MTVCSLLQRHVYLYFRLFYKNSLLCFQVRIFRFASGKMTKVFNESLQHYSELQQVCVFLLALHQNANVMWKYLSLYCLLICYTRMCSVCMCHGGVMVRTLDLQSSGCGFDSWALSYNNFRQVVHTGASVSKQYTLVIVLDEEWWIGDAFFFFWYSAVPEKQQVNDSHHLAGGSRRWRTAATAARHPWSSHRCPAAGSSWRRRTAATVARHLRSSHQWESCLGKIAEVVSRCLPRGFYFRVSFCWIVLS